MLVLRDVLRWSAAEVAEAMETTVAAVNSALQRAHATLATAAPDLDTDHQADLTDDQQRMLDAYVAAFWAKDVDAIAALLTRDAVWEMPPWDSWYQGPETIAALIGGQCPGGSCDMPMLPTRVNGQPAFGLYMRQSAADPAGATDVFVPFQLQVLDLDGDRVQHVVAFFEAGLFALAGLPTTLSEAEVRALSARVPGAPAHAG